MVSPYTSIGQPDDMQADTYNIVARYVAAISESITGKDPESLEALLSALYPIIHTRVKETEAIEHGLNRAKNALYAHEIVGEEDLSRIFDELITVWKIMTQALDDGGILFRIRVDPNDLITQ